MIRLIVGPKPREPRETTTPRPSGADDAPHSTEPLRDLTKEILKASMLAASVTAAVLVTSPASAYCQKSTCEDNCSKDEYDCVSSGSGFNWPKADIPFRFNSRGSSQFDDDEQMRKVVRRAFKTWEAVDCDTGPTSVHFTELSDTTAKPVSGKAAPTDFGIYFRDSGWPVTKGSNSEDTLAQTHQAWQGPGTITGAAIEIDTQDQTFRLADGDDGEYDLQAVLTHEVGHYLGLDHSQQPGAIMHPNYCENQHPCQKSTDELRALGDDDKAAVCRLYPPSTPSAPKAGCSATGASPSPWGWAVLPLAALVRSLVRRRRRVTGR
jgi:MYXO-CTERM domain-containing protein